MGGFGWLNSFGLGLGFLVLGFDMRFALWVWLDLWSFLLFFALGLTAGFGFDCRGFMHV